MRDFGVQTTRTAFGAGLIVVAVLATTACNSLTRGESESTAPVPDVTPATSTATEQPPITATPAQPMSGTPTPDEQQRTQAAAALAAWDRVISDAPADAIVFTSALTTLDHGWRGPNADNHKVAMFSGLIEASVPIPTEVPSAAEVQWSNGTRQEVALISASTALDEVVAEGDGQCLECTPVHVVARRLTTHQFDTSRGTAKTPVWEFTLRESRVHIYHVAVANRILHQPEADYADIYNAHGEPDSRKLTVSFVGASCCGDQACGADYTGEPVESDLAVVVIVSGHSSSEYSGPCTGEGHLRSVTVTLAEPLGDRTVLDIFGAPVPLCGPDDDVERSRCFYRTE